VVAPEDRIGAIDCLRGVALFGVLAVNLETEFRVSLFAQFLPAPPLSALDGWIAWVLRVFVEFKALALFSLLFGVGLAIQYDRIGATGRRAILLVRRMLALLALGLVHLMLIWNGDILSEYAIAGLIVLPLLFAPIWALAIGAAVGLGLYLCVPLWAHLVPFPAGPALVQHVAAATHAYGSGTFGQVLAFRLQELPLMLALHGFIFPRTVGLMLLGALLWRLGLFRRRAPTAGWLWSAAAAGVAIGLALEYAGLGAPAAIVMALGYAALVLMLAGNGDGWSRWIAPVGRMAFTNYVAQSIVMGFLFYGYGLGWFGELGLAAGLALVIAIYGAQILASLWWLRRFRFGPLEWLWRTMMYGTPPPLTLPLRPARR
jgi:uncharacterized protein